MTLCLNSMLRERQPPATFALARNGAKGDPVYPAGSRGTRPTGLAPELPTGLAPELRRRGLRRGRHHGRRRVHHRDRHRQTTDTVSD